MNPLDIMVLGDDEMIVIRGGQQAQASFCGVGCGWGCGDGCGACPEESTSQAETIRQV